MFYIFFIGHEYNESKFSSIYSKLYVFYLLSGRLWSRSGHFEGDILLPESGPNRNALKDPRMLWPNGTVIYEFNPSFGKYQILILPVIITLTKNLLLSVLCVCFWVSTTF